MRVYEYKTGIEKKMRKGNSRKHCSLMLGTLFKGHKDVVAYDCARWRGIYTCVVGPKVVDGPAVLVFDRPPWPRMTSSAESAVVAAKSALGRRGQLATDHTQTV